MRFSANEVVGPGPISALGSNENLYDTVVVDAGNDNCNLNRTCAVWTAADTKESGLREKFCELLTECRVLHVEVPAGLVNVV